MSCLIEEEDVSLFFFDHWCLFSFLLCQCVEAPLTHNHCSSFLNTLRWFPIAKTPALEQQKVQCLQSLTWTYGVKEIFFHLLVVICTPIFICSWSMAGRNYKKTSPEKNRWKCHSSYEGSRTHQRAFWLWGTGSIPIRPKISARGARRPLPGIWCYNA